MAEGVERSWRLTKSFYYVYAKVTAPIYDAVLSILESGEYLNLSEYVGDLIKKDIGERGMELAPMEAFKGEEKIGSARAPITVDTRVVNARVTKLMMDMINMLIESGRYISVSDYLRDIIKKDMESRGLEPGIEAGDEEAAEKWRPSEVEMVSTHVPMPMMESIDRLLSSGVYLRVTDYLMDLIRRDLESRGLGPSLKKE